MKGSLPLSVWGLRGEGVEQFSRSATLVSGLDHHLFLLDHVHEFDTGERPLLIGRETLTVDEFNLRSSIDSSSRRPATRRRLTTVHGGIV